MTSPGGLSPEAIQARTFEAFRQAIIRRAAGGPSSSRSRISTGSTARRKSASRSLVESLAAVPVMLLTTYRPGYRPSWLDRSYATQLSLARLQPVDSLSVVRSILPQAGPGDPLAQLILDKAEGNPFFLEELARAMVTQDLARSGLTVPDYRARRARRAHRPARGGAEAPAPDGLGPGARDLPAPARGGLGWRAGRMAHLRELTRLEFLYERSGAEEPTFVFKHALTQDVAVASILAPRRREVHRAPPPRSARCTRSGSPRSSPCSPITISQAEAWGRGARARARAAEARAAALANREALARYDQALLAAATARGCPAAAPRPAPGARRVHAVLGAFEPRAGRSRGGARPRQRERRRRAQGRVLGALGARWGGHRTTRAGSS